MRVTDNIQNICKKMVKDSKFSKRPDICTAICLATAQSICLGKEGISLVELGVHNGAGLEFIIKVVDYITDPPKKIKIKKIDMKYRIYGFDTFSGLPPLKGFKDHPEVWSEGQFSSEYTYDEMVTTFSGRAELIKGDVEDTVGEFLVNRLDTDYSLGFISLDLDLYSSTVSGLKILEDKDTTKYIPAITLIVDDKDFLVTYNPWQGEAAAINEFNAEHNDRKIHYRKEIYQRLGFINLLNYDYGPNGKPKHSFEIELNKFIDMKERAMV